MLKRSGSRLCRLWDLDRDDGAYTGGVPTHDPHIALAWVVGRAALLGHVFHCWRAGAVIPPDEKLKHAHKPAAWHWLEHTVARA